MKPIDLETSTCIDFGVGNNEKILNLKLGIMQKCQIA